MTNTGSAMGIDPTILFTSYPLKENLGTEIEERSEIPIGRPPTSGMMGGRAERGRWASVGRRVRGCRRHWRGSVGALFTLPCRFSRFATGNTFTGFGEPLPTNPRKLYISLKPMSMISPTISARYSRRCDGRANLPSPSHPHPSFPPRQESRRGADAQSPLPQGEAQGEGDIKQLSARRLPKLGCAGGAPVSPLLLARRGLRPAVARRLPLRRGLRPGIERGQRRCDPPIRGSF